MQLMAFQGKFPRVLGLIVATFCVVALALLWFVPPRICLEPESTDTDIASQVDYQKSFEWSDQIPLLYQAACMPPKNAVRFLLQNATHLRTYIAINLKIARCSSQTNDPICDASLGEQALEVMITQEIDDMITARMTNRGAITSVDYSLTRQPFPFTAIMALKFDSQPYAVVAFNLPRGNFTTLSSIENKLGAPHNRTVDAESFSLITYITAENTYTAKMEFQIDPATNEVRRVKISLSRHAEKQ